MTKEPLFAVPVAMCPHCGQLVALSPADVQQPVAGKMPVVMAEGRCACRVWTASLPPMIAVSRLLPEETNVETPKLVIE